MAESPERGRGMAVPIQYGCVGCRIPADLLYHIETGHFIRRPGDGTESIEHLRDAIESDPVQMRDESIDGRQTSGRSGSRLPIVDIEVNELRAELTRSRPVQCGPSSGLLLGLSRNL